MTATDHTICPGCKARKPGNRYVCDGCWATLPRATRTALSRRDALAVQRLAELYAELRAGTPLRRVQVTP